MGGIFMSKNESQTTEKSNSEPQNTNRTEAPSHMERTIQALTKYRPYAYYFAVALVLYLTIKYLLPFFAPFLIALLLATAAQGIRSRVSRLIPRFNPRKQSHRKLSQKITLAFLALLLLAGISLLVSSGLTLLKGAISLWQNKSSYEDLCIGGICDGCKFLEKKLSLPSRSLTKNVQNLLNQAETLLSKRFFPGLITGSVKSASSITKILTRSLVTLIATFLLCREWKSVGQIWDKVQKTRAGGLMAESLGFLKRYLKAQGKIMGAVGLAAFVGIFVSNLLVLFQTSQMITEKIISTLLTSLLLGVLTAFLDMLPFIGTGIVLVPLAIWKLLKRNLLAAVILLITYIACIILRQFLEPKLISKEMGVSPILTLLSLYIGMRLFGPIGILAGPFCLLILRQIKNNAQLTQP